MKTMCLINSKEYNYHRQLAGVFAGITGGEIVDTAGADPGRQYYEIKDSNPDVIITFDLAGHVFRTGNDTLSLNNIYARFAHILFHKPGHYGRDLKLRQNLSMFTFIPNGEDPSSYRTLLPEVPNIEAFVPVVYKNPNDREHEDNLKNIKLWWSDFQKDAML